jgi:hypothetical protein
MKSSASIEWGKIENWKIPRKKRGLMLERLFSQGGDKHREERGRAK